MSEQDAADLLAAHYLWVVQDRRGKFKLDSNTQRCILSLAKYLTQHEPKFGVMFCGSCGNDDIKFKDLCNRNMLAIDDMGKEPAEIMNYGTVMNPVIDLLEQRYQRQAFTAITTNLTAKEIKSKYGTRISDRFKEMLEVIVFQDIGYRDYFCGNP